jgi:hypothetical protein
MYSITKALLLCGLYITSNAQYNIYQVSGQQVSTPNTGYNQQQGKPTSQNYPSGPVPPTNPSGGYQQPQPNPKPATLPPVHQGQKCVPNNDFNKINCSSKGKTQCAKSYSSTSPYTTCGVSHLGVKYDFRD